MPFAHSENFSNSSDKLLFTLTIITKKQCHVTITLLSENKLTQKGRIAESSTITT